MVSGPPALFPPLGALPLPLATGSVAAVEEGAFHAALCTAYAESAFHRPAPPPPAAAPVPIKRYTDKYKLSTRPPFKPSSFHQPPSS